MSLVDEFSKIYSDSQARGTMLFVKSSNIYLFDGHTNTHFYPCSTSEVGFGFEEESYKTPTGLFRIAEKIGENQPLGMRFIQRKLAGVVHINRREAEVEHKILTRILWLSGLDKENSNTLKRYIYIHGTVNEWSVGIKNITHGCVSMKNTDIIELFELVNVGTLVYIFGE